MAFLFLAIFSPNPQSICLNWHKNKKESSQNPRKKPLANRYTKAKTNKALSQKLRLKSLTKSKNAKNSARKRQATNKLQSPAMHYKSAIKNKLALLTKSKKSKNTIFLQRFINAI